MPMTAPNLIETMPRTSEVLWDGAASLPFVLKRKRGGAILVTKLKAAAPVRLGSELKLVGGFPVKQLTLGEVKKVMLRAPKPVSLVFVNHDDVVLDNMSFLSEERGSFENEFQYEVAPGTAPMSIRESSEWSDDDGGDAIVDHRRLTQAANARATCLYHYAAPTAMTHNRVTSDNDDDDDDAWTMTAASTSSSSGGSSSSRQKHHRHHHHPRQTSDASGPPRRKASKLKLALERMNELLNRPVRRSGLNVAAGKSIVV